MLQWPPESLAVGISWPFAFQNSLRLDPSRKWPLPCFSGLVPWKSHSLLCTLVSFPLLVPQWTDISLYLCRKINKSLFSLHHSSLIRLISSYYFSPDSSFPKSPDCSDIQMTESKLWGLEVPLLEFPAQSSSFHGMPTGSLQSSPTNSKCFIKPTQPWQITQYITNWTINSTVTTTKRLPKSSKTPRYRAKKPGIVFPIL